MIQVGPKPINVTLSWDNIASVNRRLIEPTSLRFFFVKDPIYLTVSRIESSQIVKLPKHPEHSEWGYREYNVIPSDGKIKLVISKDDIPKLTPGGMLRLMGLVNIEITDITKFGVKAVFHSKDHITARKLDASFIHWLPESNGIEAQVIMPDASIFSGVAEEECKNLDEGTMIQFERLGFVRVDKSEPFTAYYAHR